MAEFCRIVGSAIEIQTKDQPVYLQVETKSKKRAVGLDTLRAVAISSVVLYHLPKPHTWRWFRAIAHFGWIGVDLFFVLSGYLIASQFFSMMDRTQTKSILPSFYARRFLRTLPSYYAVLAFTVAMLGYANQFPRGMQLGHFLIFLQNFGVPSMFTVSWSLCIEEHFYLLFPILALFMQRRGSLIVSSASFLLIAIGGALLRSWLWFHYAPDTASDPATAWGIYLGKIYYPTYSRLDGLTLGVGLAALRHFCPHIWNRVVRNARILFVLGVSLLAVTLTICLRQFGFAACVFGFCLLAVSFGLILVASTSDGFWLGRLAIPGVKFIAILSYAIYLTHSLAFSAISLIVPDTHQVIKMLLSLPAMMVFACLLHYSIERPFLKLRDRVFVLERSALVAAT